MMQTEELIAKLEDLLKQASTERSHYYVAGCCRDAIDELKRLREIEYMYLDLCR